MPNQLQWISGVKQQGSIAGVLQRSDEPQVPQLEPATESVYQDLMGRRLPLLQQPAPVGYLDYLRLKLRSIVDNPGPAKVQKTTPSDDR
ncbi:MAG: hypothetical protein ACLP59_21225 [Bryobacteraceae bacterium]